MLLYHQVIPIVVFDGAGLPMKAKTQAERRAKRAEALEKAKAFELKNDIKRAREWYQRAAPVTTDMVLNVVRELRKMKVEYLIAPYEADAQLAWMALNGHVDCVLTEDSDLIVYGAPKIIYKVDKDGTGDLFNQKNLPSLDQPPMYNITPDMFMWMCVCTGCDFFEGVRNLGMKKSHSLVKKCRTLPRLLHSIRADQRYRVGKGFMTDFYRACLVFRHQTVFDTVNGKAVHFSEFEQAYAAMLPDGIVPKSEDGSYDLDFLGKQHSDSIMKKIAEGCINPKTLVEYSEPRKVPRVENPVSSQAMAKADLNQKSKEARGFQVLPASRSSNNSLGVEKASRNQLSRTPISFDPMSMASKYLPGPRTQTTNTIWTRFKRPKSLNDVDRILGRGFGNNRNGFRLSKKPKLIDNGTPPRSPRTPSDGKPESNSPMNRAKRRLSSTLLKDRPSPARPMNSITRFVNRFQAPARRTAKARKSTHDRDDTNHEEERERKKPRSGSPEPDACEREDAEPERKTGRNLSSADTDEVLIISDEDDPVAGSTDEVLTITDEDDNAEGDGSSSKVDEDDYVIRSRFFPTGKRLMLPTKSLTASRGRPVVPRSARSHPRSAKDLENFGRHVRGRTIINKKLKQREARRHTS